MIDTLFGCRMMWTDGAANVAYYDAADHDLKYITRGPDGKWSAPIIVDASSANVGGEPVLALDPSGAPGIAYLDAAAGQLKYAHLVGGSWAVSVIDPHNAAPHPSLTFDAGGGPLVSFYRPSAGALELAEFNGPQWKVRQVAKLGSVDHAGSGFAG